MPATTTPLAPAPAAGRLQAGPYASRSGDGDAEKLELADDPAVSPVGILTGSGIALFLLAHVALGVGIAASVQQGTAIIAGDP
jgi:hypothetical protein